VDKAEFLPLNEARKKIHADQRTFLERLAEVLDPPRL
jgi:predicted NUDIX family NTP pyrophosphohydrolase